MNGSIAIQFFNGCWFALFLDGDTIAASQDLPDAKTADEAWKSAQAIEEQGDL